MGDGPKRPSPFRAFKAVMERDSKTTERKHRTRWSVRFADRFSAVCITVGGIGTILAVSAVFLFLGSVVVPLFSRGKATPETEVPVALPAGVHALHAGIDEYRVAAWTLDSDGALRVFRADKGDSIATLRAAAPDSLSTASFDIASRSFALALSDGSFRLARISFTTDYADESTVPDVASLQTGETIVAGGAIVQKTSDGSLRRQTPVLTIDGNTASLVRAPVRGIDHFAHESTYTVAAIGAGDSVVVCRVDHVENEFTGQDTVMV